MRKNTPFVKGVKITVRTQSLLATAIHMIFLTIHKDNPHHQYVVSNKRTLKMYLIISIVYRIVDACLIDTSQIDHLTKYFFRLLRLVVTLNYLNGE